LAFKKPEPGGKERISTQKRDNYRKILRAGQNPPKKKKRKLGQEGGQSSRKKNTM